MISVIIQGPIISNGFNCISNINALIDTFLSIPSVEKVILSTWQKNALFKDREGLIYLEHEMPQFFDSMNRYKQFFSVYKGCQYISNNLKSKYVLKVRTDIYLEKKIIDYILNYLEHNDFDVNNNLGQENYIITSHSYNKIPFFVGDLYFAGTVGDVMRFVESYTRENKFCFQWLPETDITLKYLSKHKKALNISWQTYIKPIRNRTSIGKKDQNIWLDVYCRYFSVFPEHYFTTMLWRGKTYLNPLHDYFTEWNECKTNRFNYEVWMLKKDNRLSISIIFKDYCAFLSKITRLVYQGVKQSGIQYWTLIRLRIVNIFKRNR